MSPSGSGSSSEESGPRSSRKHVRTSSDDFADFDCAVCCDMLLDPVVAPCGHDFCLDCIQRWASAAWDSGQPAHCPLCRTTLPSSLAVCLRLKKTIERLHPEATERRRAEVALAESAPAVDASPPAAQQQQLLTYPPMDSPVAATQWSAQTSHSLLTTMFQLMGSLQQQLAASAATPDAQQQVTSTAAHALACAGHAAAVCSSALLPCWSAPAGGPAAHADQQSAAGVVSGVPVGALLQQQQRQPQPAKQSWQMASDSPYRLEVARAIIGTLQARGWHLSLGPKLADAVRLLELFLYRTAASREAYINASDLEARIVAAVQQRAVAAAARRERMQHHAAAAQQVAESV